MKAETIASACGLEIEAPASWVRVKTQEEMNRHQKRDMFSFLTRMSEPMPCRRQERLACANSLELSEVHTTEKTAKEVAK